MASSPPSTPTVPSYMPACGIASVCDPVPTRRQRALGAFHPYERVAHRIFAHGEALLLPPSLQKGPRLHVPLAEDDPSYVRPSGGLIRVGDRSQGEQLFQETLSVDRKGASLMNGCLTVHGATGVGSSPCR